MKRSENNFTYHSKQRPRRGAQRGVALLLVVLGMAVATILATTALTSRMTAPAAAENAVAAAEADWAAQGTANFVATALETQLTVDISGGEIMTGQVINGAVVDCTVTDLNGDPPAADDLDLLLHISATVDGITVAKQRKIRRKADLTPSQAISPTLDEFAAFVTNDLRIDGSGYLGNWSAGPAGGGLIKIGTGFSASENLDISGAVDVSRVGLFPDNTASSALVSRIQADGYGGGFEIPMVVPAAPAALPNDIATLAVDGRTVTNSGAGRDRTLPVAAKWGDMTVSATAIIRMDELIGDEYSFGNVTITDAQVIIHGDVEVHIRGNLTMSNASIELADPDSSLTIYAAGNIDVRQSFIGAASPSTYIDPRRLRIFTLRSADGGSASPNIDIRNSSLVMGNWHCPTGHFHIDNAILCGRVTATELRIENNGRLLYDQSLDRGVGFTADKGSLYTGSLQPIAGLAAALASFDPAWGFQQLPSHIDTELQAQTAQQQQQDQGALLNVNLLGVNLSVGGGGGD